MNYNIIAYLIYSLFTGVTIGVVGRYIHRNGRYFVLQIIKDIPFGDFINNGLLAGYYLVNIGYVFYALSNWETINCLMELLEMISVQTGSIYLLLGVLHFLNMLGLRFYAWIYNISLIKKQSLKKIK